MANGYVPNFTRLELQAAGTPSVVDLDLVQARADELGVDVYVPDLGQTGGDATEPEPDLDPEPDPEPEPEGKTATTRSK